MRDGTAGRRYWILFLLLCAIGAAAAIRRMVALASPPPPAAVRFGKLDADFASKAGLTLLHIIPSLLFVLLAPLQFLSRLRRSRPRWHRWIGRVAMALGIVMGVSALRLSLDPVGGLAESTATMFFGAFFLFSLGKAWWHIRHGRMALHRAWAIRMVAIALGVATTRPIMGVFFATSRFTGLQPEQFFGPAMWLGLTSTYLAAEAWMVSARRGDAAGSMEASRSTVPANRRVSAT